MNVTVSDLAYYCAHCGHLEPVNLKEFHDSDFTIGLVYSHKGNCKVGENLMLNDLFMAAINSRTNAIMNECNGRHHNQMVANGVSGFIHQYLSSDSHFMKWNPVQWWNDLI